MEFQGSGKEDWVRKVRRVNGMEKRSCFLETISTMDDRGRKGWPSEIPQIASLDCEKLCAISWGDWR
jgi:hypothetical protein